MFTKLVSRLVLLFLVIFTYSSAVLAQKKPIQKPLPTYKSVYWEISGNGLKKASYLFGTMHVSNKMVFHLSDSFYAGIRNADIVALELNPEDWQREIPRYENQSELYKNYYATYYTDYINQKTIGGDKFIQNLQLAMQYEPSLNNSLLYRTDTRMENFQEDTYLDLYIYQTGKKLNKKTAGVETFMGSQKYMMEGMMDAVIDRKKNPNAAPKIDYNIDYNQLLQDAYRKGDLDMLDSISRLTEYSEKFTEKFLYQRNEVQAHAMDSIIRSGLSLFVGVGAAHLPGKRGVIELLRRKGYTLRPIYMQDRDAAQKKLIDSLKSPVQFKAQYATDSLYHLSVPGNINVTKDLGNEYSGYYADMANGAYYVVNRININPFFSGYQESAVLKLIDSLAYENIPGSILKQEFITTDGVKGISIATRTKTGNVQQYRIYTTPQEVIMFKMGGKGDYVLGEEGQYFFNSIHFAKPITASGQWIGYSPEAGGFKVNLPQNPQTFYIESAEGDRLPEWRYQVEDPNNGDQYLILRKSIYSLDFIEADTFDTYLLLQSFVDNPKWNDKKDYKNTVINGRLAKSVNLQTKDGKYVMAVAIKLGAQHYLLATQSSKPINAQSPFFSSFQFEEFQYPESTKIVDTLSKFSVQSRVYNKIDSDVDGLMAYVVRKTLAAQTNEDYNNTNTDGKAANFIDKRTGEVILVGSYKYPKYYQYSDSIKFWNTVFLPDSTLILHKKEKINKGSGAQAWLVEWKDTASTLLLRKLILVKGMRYLNAVTVVDSTLPESAFITDFFKTFDYTDVEDKPSIFSNKEDTFFADFNSKDTAIAKFAKSAVSEIQFDKNGYQSVIDLIDQLPSKSKDYVTTKQKLITQLGAIKDTSIKGTVAEKLVEIYHKSEDSSTFQHAALMALTQLKTPKSTLLFKDIILQDPPAFDETDGYYDLFSNFGDSLELGAMLYPEILNLSNIEDYKRPIRSLLVTLIDSNKLEPSLYEDYLGNIYFDAKIAMKKRQNADDLSVDYSEEENYSSNNSNRNYSKAALSNRGYGSNNSTGMLSYMKLLVPYYSKNPNLPSFFNKLLRDKNNAIKAQAATTLMKNNIPVADSIWVSLFSDKNQKYPLLYTFRSMGQGQKIPKSYASDKALANAVLEFEIGKSLEQQILIKQEKQVVLKNTVNDIWCYKFKEKNNNDWKLAIISLSPNKNKILTINESLFYIGSSKIPVGKEVSTAEEQIKKMMITDRDAGKYFFNDSNSASNSVTYRN